MVLVPVSRGLMQPYRRLRPATSGIIMAAVSPTAPPLSPGAISVYTPETAGTVGIRQPAVARDDAAPLTGVVGTTGSAAGRGPAAVPVVSMRRPENNDGVWIMFGGEKWVSAGTAIPFVAAEFVRVGEYAGFPVFARPDFTQEVIYLPSTAGFIAPYRLK
jgi:hypothetical protein